MIDTFCWNVRGFNKSVRRRNFRNWFRLSKALFGSIIETRVKAHRFQKYILSTFPGWNSVGNYEHAKLGRIWVVWDPIVSVSVLHKSDQMITCLIKLPNVESELVVSFVYAVNCIYGRRFLWSDLSQLAANQCVVDKPWLILGDFNQSLDPADASLGSSRITGGMEEFRECLLNANIFDLPYKGHHFTWWNKRDANPIAKKLDRALVNDNWLLSFPFSVSIFGEPEFSDHSPCCVQLGSQNQGKKSPFKFSNFLLHHPNFLGQIAEAWRSMSFQGTSMFIISKKLKLLKRTIKSFNRENYSGLEKRVLDAFKVLTSCQSNFLNDPSPHLASLEKEAHRKWQELALAEERFLCQRSRISWLANGDSNSAFFHKMIAARRASNQIHYLLDNSGSKIENHEDLAAHCVDFYSTLLGGDTQPLSQSDLALISTLTPFSCNDEDRSMLMATVTPEEIKPEIFSLPCNKSPGPDGYTSEFLKASWSVIGSEIIAAVLEFFSSGQILKQWNCTAITLVPKKVNANKITDFRPISCCNVLYKVI